MTTQEGKETDTEDASASTETQQQQQQQTQEDDFDKERALNTIRAQRESEAALKKQVSELNAKIKGYEDKDRTELERLTAERDQLKQEREELIKSQREARTRNSFLEAAQKSGALKPEALFKLANGDIEIDDNGEPKNLTTLIKGLRSDYPELFSNSDVDAGSGRGRAPNKSSMNDLLRAARGR